MPNLPVIERSAVDMRSSEQALRESEEKFRTLAETTDCAIFVWREYLLYVNPALCTIVGYSTEELLDQFVWEQAIHPDDLEWVRANGRARLRGENVPRHYEFRVVTKAGEERWVHFSAGAIRYNGEPAVLGTAFDITERKRAEQALRESEENLRTLAGNANDGILVHVDGRIVFANPRLSDICGYAVPEILQLTIGDLVRPDEQPKIHRRYQSRLKGEAVPGQYETIAVRKDGSEIPIEITAALSVWRGQPAIIVIVRDVASRKHAEAELFQEKERAQVTLESIGDGVITTDISGRIEYLNPVAEALTGWSLASAQGQGLLNVFQDKDGNTSVLLQGLNKPVGIVLNRKGDRLYWTEVPTPGVSGANGGQNRVWELNLRTMRRTLVHFGDPEPTDITVGRDGTVYWTCTSAGVIVEASRGR